MTISEKVAYIQGLYDGLGLDGEKSGEARILSELLDVMKEVGQRLDGVDTILDSFDEELDAYRIYNVAPWVSPKMQGVIGTNPIRYEIAGVESADGDAEMFRSLLTVRGGGRMEFPLVSDITPGEYRISIRVSNEGHSRVLENIFTFNVKEK